jgi:hypothetical protein
MREVILTWKSIWLLPEELQYYRHQLWDVLEKFQSGLAPALILASLLRYNIDFFIP